MQARLPVVLRWFRAQESLLLPTGRALQGTEFVVATKIGLGSPGRVRVLVLDNFPFPTDPELVSEAKDLGLDLLHEHGRAMGYAVLLKRGAESDMGLLAHELAHVAQQEKLGVEAFLQQYLYELKTMGYARSFLEREATEKAFEVLNSD